VFVLPFDGIVAKCVVKELSGLLEGGRIEKIFQPEPDEININIRSKNSNYRLLLSANPTYPRIHITGASKENPSSPPVFCMLLRKHLAGGRIIGFDFNNYERIIGIRIESANELGDISVKKLIIEIMGKHSNIILVNPENRIIDAIKHVDSDVSSVREVMPARPYTPPPAQDKKTPEEIDTEVLISGMENSSARLEKYLLENIKGFSPLLCREICCNADVEYLRAANSLTGPEKIRLKAAVENIFKKIIHNEFRPTIAYEDESHKRPLDFHCLKLSQFVFTVSLDSISEVLDRFYKSKDEAERLRQKQADLLKVLNNSIERCRKKLSIQEETLREVADREKLRLYGELITANIYNIPKGAKTARVQNYYSENNEWVDIPLDENLLPQQNAQMYYKRYAKAKNTYIHTKQQIEETRQELDYLESVLQSLDNCVRPEEIDEVRYELFEQGYMAGKMKSRYNGSGKKSRAGSKKNSVEKPSEPLRFKSSDGYDIFVGKNNRQNDWLTLRQASSNDIWLHTKNIHGSHVIIKKRQSDIPETTLKEAAILAAYFSKARYSANVPVDYTTVKNVSKPSGAKPGMVIYVNYKTITVTPDAETVKNWIGVCKHVFRKGCKQPGPFFPHSQDVRRRRKTA